MRHEDTRRESRTDARRAKPDARATGRDTGHAPHAHPPLRQFFAFLLAAGLLLAGCNTQRDGVRDLSHNSANVQPQPAAAPSSPSQQAGTTGLHAESRLVHLAVADRAEAWQRASDNFRFASAVAAFGLLLRDSRHKGAANYAGVAALARSLTGADLHGHRTEFVRLVETANTLSRQQARN